VRQFSLILRDYARVICSRKSLPIVSRNQPSAPLYQYF
jgi:hypothetical protein